MMNNHCHPERPSARTGNVACAIGPPRKPATVVAELNSARRDERSLAENQCVK